MKHTTFAYIALGFVALGGMTAQVEAVPFTLDASSAGIFAQDSAEVSSFLSSYGVNNGLDSHFYNFNPNTGETGIASNYFSSIYAGNATSGYQVTITWDGNPQPILTGAFLKAGAKFLLWDEADFAPFNLGDYDSLVLVQNGIKNSTGRSYLGVSHAGVFGEEGGNRAVPDNASTGFLLGLSVLVLILGSARGFPGWRRRVKAG